ncbi:MAG: glycosyltransferase family 4 protein [Saprospiraceae bacterium]|nr:glycosyltransferase family 4 protein [Saprospiraceae bacterium]
MKLAYVATYPPRACGIGTFTQNLIKAVCANDGGAKLSNSTRVFAMTDGNEAGAYPSAVSFCIEDQNQGSYLAAAALLNESDVDLVVLQHEYGIFGGQDGAYVLTLLDELQKPAVATFHTVLKDPSRSQEFVLHSIASKVGKVVVMSHLAKQLLQEVYKVPKDKIAIIEHGVPECKTASRLELRSKLGFEGRRILFTFGLIGRSKGLETVINALPAIVAVRPETLYVVLGKTHPGIVRESGEEYREYLLDLAQQKGVADNLLFVNEFAEESVLWEYLRACDIYLTPYLNEAQITSGTLSYAIGAGAAVVSTPYWHAQELLKDGRGQFFDFRNDETLAEILLDLFGNDEKLENMRSLAAQYGKNLKWSLIGKQYLKLFQQMVREKKIVLAKNLKDIANLPPINFKHLQTMTDDTGILQHAKYSLPNRNEGYCLDDNARALIAVLSGRKQHPNIWLDQAAGTYLSFIYHCQNEDGQFKNFMGYDRQFLESVGSEDAFGRGICAVGYAIENPLNGGFYSLAMEIFKRALPHCSQLQSLRAIAFSILGISSYLKKNSSDENMLNLLHLLRSKLCYGFEAHSTEDWHWFEPYMTYCNAILPLALFHSLEYLPDTAVLETAMQSTRFLEKTSLSEGFCRPVGCNNFYQKGSECAVFDQQPMDVLSNVLLFPQAYKVTGKQEFFEKALLCNAWFYGKNELRLSLYDAETGGCCDGLTATGVNQNQGAESTLAYLLCSLAVEAAQAKHNRRGKAIMSPKGSKSSKEKVFALKKSEDWEPGKKIRIVANL